MKTNSVKEKIIDSTTELIVECASIEGVTIRDIAARAGVGVGLINYHFHTKENLINQCVQKIIGNIIENFDKLYQSLNMEPLDKLRFLTKRMCSFVVQNQGISRVSMLSDLSTPNSLDNTSQTTKAYLPVMKEVYNNKKSDRELYQLTLILQATIQLAFLRRDILMQGTGVDFYNTEQREQFIDRIIDTIFK